VLAEEHALAVTTDRLLHTASKDLTKLRFAGNGTMTAQATRDISSPEVMAAAVSILQGIMYREHVDFLAHDIWSLACLLVWMLSGCHPFLYMMEEDVNNPELEEGDGLIRFIMARQHDWVSSLIWLLRVLQAYRTSVHTHCQSPAMPQQLLLHMTY